MNKLTRLGILGILIILIAIVDFLWALNVFGAEVITGKESVLKMLPGVIIMIGYMILIKICCNNNEDGE